jgi:uncharacterized repeat protein (TIGR01451 family)
MSHLDPALWPKVEPGLLKVALSAGREPLSFIVILNEQADLPPLPLGEGRGEGRYTQRPALVSALQATAERSQAAIRAYLDLAQADGRVRRYTPFWIINGLAVTAERDTLFALAARPDVKIIRADRQRWLKDSPDKVTRRQGDKVTSSDPVTLSPSHLVTLSSSPWNLARIRADLVHTALGIDGSGVVVASMDTGVDWQHPALASRYRGYDPKGLPNHVGNWFSATSEDYRYPGDGNGHGTHTTGIVLGEGVGVAPGAQWIAVKVFHNQGFTFDSWLHAGFQWLLAPNGDPSRAPDIVNASWGNDAGTDETFRPDVQALRAAGILVIFSAGNAGPRPASVGSPASFPESFAVGASDPDDDVPNFSSRGPSPFDEVKPEVVAPGVNVRSTEPGGGYGTRSGTSMAAPHVAGLVALLVQAEPTLSLTATEQIITRTAVPLGEPVPNNNAGWGRIDAYAAVASVAEVGFLEGRIVRNTDSVPIPEAVLSVARRDQPPFVQVVTDADGRYRLSLPPGIYDVRIAAFGYLPATELGVNIATHETRQLNMALSLAPAGVFFGRVTDANSGAPLSATLRIADTPLVTHTDPRTGLYSLSLPPGVYTVTVASPRHRVGHGVVTVEVNIARNLDFVLPPAPSILLIDSGAWYYSSQISYFRQSLDDLDYLYDLWLVKQVPADVPQPAGLAPYDIVIWSAPQDAPGFIGASKAITTYLEAGGRLLLTGQDVAYWDGGGTGTFAASYFRDYLHAAFVKDDAGSRTVDGIPAGPLSGLSLGLEGGDGADNQRYPDAVQSWRAGDSTPVALYAGTGQNAALTVDVCVPYRALYLAFGLEGVNSRAMRQAVLARAINYLMAAPADIDFHLSPVRLAQVSAPGSVVTYTFTLRNTGQQPDTFNLDVGRHQWPVSLWDETFTRPLTDSITVSNCDARRLGIKVEVPPNLGWNVRDPVWLTVASERARIAGASLTRTLEVETKTPAPALLVDDDRWYDLEAAYKGALSANGYAFDVWDMHGGQKPAAEVLTLDHINLYPLVVWFTGYDWYDTLSPEEEEMLARYLDGGGRLIFSSQDYFYTNGLTPFGVSYLGVLTYTEDTTATRVTGVATDPVGHDLGPFPLHYPYPNHSDKIVPGSDASPAFVGERGQVVAVTHAGSRRLEVGSWKSLQPFGLSLRAKPPTSNLQSLTSNLQPSTFNPHYRSVFLAFPMETMRPADAAVFLYRAVDWLAPLAGSTLTVDRPIAAAGDRLSYVLRVRNDSRWPLPAVQLTSPLPADTRLVTDSLKGADYETGEGTLRWQGVLAPGGAHTVTFQLDLPAQVVSGTSFTSTAHIEDGIGLWVDRDVVVRVNVPNLVPSEKLVDRPVARPGELVTYTLALRNAGTLDAATVTVTDALPAGLTFEPDSLWFSAGQGEVADNVVHWRGPVGRRGLVIITYAGRVSPAQRMPLVNTVTIRDEFNVTVQRQAVIRVSNVILMPVVKVTRQAPPLALWERGGG